MVEIVRFDGVNYVYSKGTPFEHKALDDINYSFEKGKITGIIGHTGSGKSTMAQMLNGLLKPDSGIVTLDGENIWEKKKDIRKVRFKVGLVFQYPEYQLFDETVKKDISFGPKNMGLDEEEINKRVIDSLNFVGLDESYLELSPFDLSGGQKRRVAIAGIIAMRPEILVLDEPAAGLDPKGRDDIFSRIKAYKEQTDSTVVIISHSMEDVCEFCDNIVVLNKSKVFLSGTVDEVFSKSEEIMNVGLMVPQATKILIELKKMGFDVDTSRFTAKDTATEIIRLLKRVGGENI